MTLLVLIALLQSAPSQAEGREVVVTARPLIDTERAWRECMARQCPPDQEIAAAVAHAENQFVAGDYKQARSTLNRTIGHVRGREREHPVALGNLWRAKSRIEAHLGEGDRSRTAASQSLLALKAGLPENDARIFAQRVEVGDALLQQGQFRTALSIYRGIASRAREAGQLQIEGHALLRTAALWTTLATGRFPYAPAAAEARKAIRNIGRTTDPSLAPFREAAEILLLKLAAGRGDGTAVDRLVERFRGRATERPLLVYAPPIDPFSAAGAALPGGSSAFENQWIDIGFWVAPDGGVKDADVLRGSDRLDDVWVEPVLQTVRGRRYAPLKSVGQGSPGLFRVERVTYTSDYVVPIGSRIRQRSGTPRVVFTDLTVDPPAG